jgi:ADP-ribose pyrophosphatase YjhB (NUDIX family)
MTKHYLDLLDEIRAIAQLGLNYSKDPFDRERYERLMNLASQHYSEMTGLPAGTIRERFSRELGYITPKIGVQGALFDPADRILLERRKDDGLWGLPAGWVESGEGPEHALIREFREEAGLDILPVELIGFNSRLPGDFNQPHSSIHVLYYCSFKGGTLQKSHESLEMTYCEPAVIAGWPPDSWHMDHGLQAERSIQYHLANKHKHAI